ncbi:uncharacterized protein ACMZJ9_011690 [Mantella aurantiaca]
MNGCVGFVLLLCCGWRVSQASIKSVDRPLLSETQRCISTPGTGQRTFVGISMYCSYGPALSYQLYIVTCDEAATATVTVSQPKFSKTLSIPMHSSGLVTLGHAYMVSEATTTSKAILVTSDVEVSVFAYHHYSGHGDAMTLLPLEDLGTEYFISTPNKSGSRKQFAVVNGIQGTVEVTVTVSGSIKYNGKIYSTGNNILVFLGYQQVIQFSSSSDLTGTRITSTAPIAVFSGHSCYTGISGNCDPVVEQLHPVKNWGTFFAVFPMFSHTQDIVDIISADVDTEITIKDLGKTSQHSLQKGSRIQHTLKNGIMVNSSKPIMISYLFQESKSRSFVSSYDPFMTTVPPSLLGRNYYQFYTRIMYHSFLMIVSQNILSSEFYLDQKPLSSYSYSAKEFDGFRAWEVSMGKSDGRHEIYNLFTTFTIYIYGAGYQTSYGYSMGQGAPYPALSSLRCYPHEAEFILPYSMVSTDDPNVPDIHLEDAQCKAGLEGKAVVVKIPLHQCGSTVQQDTNGRAFYNNTIYGTISKPNVHHIEIPVKCEMDSIRAVNINLFPQVTGSVSLGDYNVSLRLYNSDSFTHPITEFPLEVDLHSILYVELAVESEGKDLQILAENVIASPILNDQNKNYDIIKNGCLQDSTLQTYPTRDSRSQRFSFHVFKFIDIPDMYLSCDVVICYDGAFPNRCAQGCRSARRKREILSSEPAAGSARLSAGPVILRNRQGLGQVFLAALCIVGVLAVTGLLGQRRYYKRQQNSLLHALKEYQ